MEKYVIMDKYFDGNKINMSLKVFKIEDGIITGYTNPENLDSDGIKNSNAYIDLRGKFVTPGLIDSHDHFTLTSLKLKYQIDFSSVRSFDDFKQILIENKDKIIHGWLQGYGINEYNMKEKRLPDKKIIDEIYSDIPVFITQMTEHYGISNSRAMEIANIEKNTESPPNSKIGRFSDGNPNGILYEANAMDLVKRKIPEYNKEDYVEAIRFGSEQYINFGISAVKDIGGTGKDINEETRINAINELAERNELKLRIAIALPVYSINDVKKKIELSKMVKENKIVKFAGFKMFLDGSILSKTAWMKNFYADGQDNKGISLWDLEQFKKALQELSGTGHPVSIHVIGDKAIETALDCIEELNNAGKASKYNLIHCYKLNGEIINRIKRLNVNIETQLAFLYFIGDAISDNIGPDQSKCLFPLRTLMEKKIHVSNGSDSPVTPFNPIYGIYSSMYRRTITGKNEQVYSGQEEIDLTSALKTYTKESSETIGWEQIGSLEEGKMADFTVWPEDPENTGNDLENWLKMKLKVCRA
ncbi:amidohydrolase family protein [Ferroplasma sp.]|uniref:amidohydrolase n=1 Tax=Ferroplasma sp. TaxID=2591003 RepID=UPI00307F8ACD